MNLKNIILIGFLLAIFVGSICAVSAADDCNCTIENATNDTNHVELRRMPCYYGQPYPTKNLSSDSIEYAMEHITMPLMYNFFHGFEGFAHECAGAVDDGRSLIHHDVPEYIVMPAINTTMNAMNNIAEGFEIATDWISTTGSDVIDYINTVDVDWSFSTFKSSVANTFMPVVNGLVNGFKSIFS